MPQRRDGRENDELRPMSLVYEGLARVDGSARFSFGNTSAIASVSGPIEVRLASELPSKATFEVLVRPISNVPATESKALASDIRSTLEPSLILTKNPRSLVQLVVQALSPSTSHVWETTLTAAMINAASLAFLNASSVPMRGVDAAVAVCQTASDALVVDPSDEELLGATGWGCFAFMIVGHDISNEGPSDCVWASWRSRLGGVDEDVLLKAKDLSRRSAQLVYEEMRKKVANAYGVEAKPMGQPHNPASDDGEMMI